MELEVCIDVCSRNAPERVRTGAGLIWQASGRRLAGERRREIAKDRKMCG